MIALVYRAGGRLAMWATMRLIIVGIIWLAVSSPLLPRPYSAGVAAALIVAGMSLSSKPRPRYSPFVSSVVFLGDISYSLYCTHLLTFGLVAWTVTNLAISPLGHAWAYMAAMLTAGLVVGAATYLAFEKPTTNSVQKLIERPRSPMKSAIGIYSTNPHPSRVAGNEASGMRGLDVGSRNAGRSALRPDQALPQQAAGYSRKSTQPRFTSRSSRMHLCRSGCAGAHPERSR
jgi:hypothetical protein